MTVADGKVTVNVPGREPIAAAAAKSGSARSPARSQVAIGRGENSGHTLTYYNVVRRWVKLGDWNGKAQTFTLPVSRIANAGFSRSRTSTSSR